MTPNNSTALATPHFSAAAQNHTVVNRPMANQARSFQCKAWLDLEKNPELNKSAGSSLCIALAPEAFKVKAAEAGFKVFDIRDRSDRAAKQVRFNNDIGANMDEFIGFLEKGVVVPKEKILIYDNVGKQVVWLQYYLEKAGVKDYYFLKGGVKALDK